MTPTTVLILSRDAAEYGELLAEMVEGDVRFLPAPDRGMLPDGADTATVVLGEPDRIAASLPQLRALAWAQSTWAGVTPLLPAARSGLVVTGVKDVFGTQMAEYVVGHLLAHALDLPSRREAQAQGRWLGTPTGTLAGTTLGVMGTGSIGAEIARRAGGFGMRLLGFSRSGEARAPFEAVYPTSRLHEFLGRCDYVAAVLPDTADTRDLLDAHAFAAMRPGAVLVNVGRGTLVVDADLVAALASGNLGGAVLDVFREEPLPPAHPFWNAPRLSVTAHVAARSWPRDIAAIFADNLARFRAGQELRYRLDPEQGY